MEKNKHLTAEDRKIIEDSLNHKMTYVSIANALGKDPTTISKEVKHIPLYGGKEPFTEEATTIACTS